MKTTVQEPHDAVLASRVAPDPQPIAQVTKPLPLSRRPLLDHLDVRFAPEQDYRRFFRLHEQALMRRNLHVSLLAPLDLMTANDAHIDTWEALIPTLDSRNTVIATADLIALGVFGPKGDLVATAGTRIFTIETSVADAFESLDLLYGSGAPAMRTHETFGVTAPSARRLRGRVAYRGGFWVRPDMRRSALPRILARLARTAAMAAWQPDHHIGLGTAIFEKPHIHEAYGIARTERAFTYHRGNRLHWEGVLTLTDREEAERLFVADLADLDAQGL